MSPVPSVRERSSAPAFAGRPLLGPAPTSLATLQGDVRDVPAAIGLTSALMANVVQCTGCGTKLKAPENSAGKKIRCPKCQAVIAIPAESAPAPSPSGGFVPAPTGPGQRSASPSSYPASAPSGPVPAPTFSPAPAAAPTASSFPAPSVAAAAPAPAAEQWRVRMILEGTLQTFGPVTKAELDQWFHESRLDAETELERNLSGQWVGAAAVYPSLAPSPATSPARPEPSATPTFAPAPTAAPSPPRIGLPQIAPVAPAKKANDFPNILTGATSAPVTSAAPVAPGGIATGIDPTSVSNIPGRKLGRKKSESMAMGQPGRPMGGGVSSRSKMVAGLLGIFLGAWGVHRFYLGYMGMGAIQIAVTICTCGLGGIWGLVEGIMILVGSFDEDADGRKLAE